jgi:aspartate aminotransferase-like enzyme
MLRVGPYLFKRAETSQEFQEIHCLNYRTFVTEIPQHSDPGDGRLIDKFHDKNVYFIVVCDGRVVGMVSSHDRPPFSVADRLPDPSILQRPGTRPLEVRLLAVEPDKRNSTVFFGLLWSLYDYALARGYTQLYISGVRERLPLYRRLGFEPLGPAVPSGGAWFVPMVLVVGQLPERVAHIKELWEVHMDRASGREWQGSNGVAESGVGQRAARDDGQGTRETGPLDARSLSLAPGSEVCLLPGPVTSSAAVHAAFHQPPIYHRGPEFIALFRKVRQTLGVMVGGRDVALFNGSGTLANEAVAATLASNSAGGRGILLVNGEFGRRLASQATRFGLRPRLLEWRWGQPWDLEEVDAAVADEPPGSWVWGVHLESSTGVLNDLAGLVEVAQARGVRVCADCISSLGAVPLDLRGVYLATGATGKSLGSYAGLAIVFANAHDLERLDMGRVPSYLDIPAALANEGPRYTFPSPTLRALDAALADYVTQQKAEERYQQYAALGAWVRLRLRELELEPLAADAWACPVVTTFAPPGDESSGAFVARCRSWGFAIGGQSQYLAERRLVQIATMGAVARSDCDRLFDYLQRWLPQHRLSCQPVAF